MTDMFFGFFSLIPMVLGVIFWVFVIVIAVKLVRRANEGPARSGGSSAQHILEERYARGEITKEEFLERRAALQAGSTP
ncbi:MAG: SHOCT domain-containing protein [Actinomycetota bacterium]